MRRLVVLLIGLIAIFYVFEANVWETEARYWRLSVVVSTISILVAINLLWLDRPNTYPLILFFMYTGSVTVVMIVLQTGAPPLWPARLLMPLSVPFAVYAMQPFELTRQWKQLIPILFVLFGSYGLYQIVQAEPEVDGWTYTIFLSGLVVYVTFLVKHQRRRSPETAQLLMGVRFLSVAILPSLFLRLTLSAWIGEEVMFADAAILSIAFIFIGFIVLNTNSYTHLVAHLDRPLIALTIALSVYATYILIRSQINTSSADLILIILITLGVLIAAPWQRQIIREAFGAGELSADFMQSVANQLAPPTYDNIQQVVVSAAESLKIQHASLITRTTEQRWTTLVTHNTDPIQDIGQLEWISFMRLVDAEDSPVHTLNWIRLIVPLQGASQNMGWLLLSAPEDIGRFHERQLLQIDTFGNLLLNAIQTITTTERASFFAAETIRGMAKTRREIGGRLHTELLDDLRRLEHQLMSVEGDSHQLVREMQSAVRDILHELYPVDLDQDLESIAIATLALYKSADFSIVPTYSNLAHHRFSKDQRLAVFFILREALNNVRRHAHAKQVTVRLAVYHDMLTITICDDGQAPATFEPGYGLMAMDHWTKQFSGKATFNHRLNIGTTVQCTMEHSQ